MSPSRKVSTITPARCAPGEREAHTRQGRTICDALMAAMPGEMTFSINSKLLAQGVTATDAEVGAAVAYAFRELKLVVEPGGAVGLAALLAGRIDARGKNVVIVLSGGKCGRGPASRNFLAWSVIVAVRAFSASESAVRLMSQAARPL